MTRTESATRDVWDSTLGGKPAVGAVAERSRSTSMQDVEMFSAMTGDRNPLHYNPTLAAQSQFGGLIVQGGITSDGPSANVIAAPAYFTGPADASGNGEIAWNI